MFALTLATLFCCADPDLITIKARDTLPPTTGSNKAMTQRALVAYYTRVKHDYDGRQVQASGKLVRLKGREEHFYLEIEDKPEEGVKVRRFIGKVEVKGNDLAGFVNQDVTLKGRCSVRTMGTPILIDGVQLVK